MKPKFTRRHIPFFYKKSESEFQVDVYERYDEMVVRQTAIHMADEIWNAYPFQKLIDWVFENIPEEKNKNIVDLGCGVGRLAAEMAKRFSESEIWGIDFSYQMLRRAHEFWVEGKTIEFDFSSRGIFSKKINGEKLPNIKFGLAKAEELPFENNSQNIITHTFLFDRLNNPTFSLREMYRVLHPEGQMLMVTPFNFQSKKNWEKLYPLEKTLNFLEKEKWKIVSCENMEFHEPLDGHGNFISWKCSAIVAKKKS